MEVVKTFLTLVTVKLHAPVLMIKHGGTEGFGIFLKKMTHLALYRDSLIYVVEHKNVVIQDHLKCLVHLFFKEGVVVDYSDIILIGQMILTILSMIGLLRRYAALVAWAIVDIIMRGDHHTAEKDMFLNPEVSVTVTSVILYI